MRFDQKGEEITHWALLPLTTLTAATLGPVLAAARVNDAQQILAAARANDAQQVLAARLVNDAQQTLATACA